MPVDSTHYEVLGVPRNADAQAIKKRYRELVRKHHPDVRSDKAEAEKRFVEIIEAYKTLVDPLKRSAYDATLPEVTRPVSSSNARPGSDRIDPGQRTSQRRQPVSPRVALAIKEAELAFIRRKLTLAESLCRRAISLDQTCARAHAILGDIHRAHRKYQHAINEYTLAVQFDPADAASREKMEKLIERINPVRFSFESSDGKVPPLVVALHLMGWAMVVFMLFLVYIYPGKPVTLFRQMNAPFVSSWSWNLIMLLLGDGALAGFLLGSSGIVNHPDEELIFESGAHSRTFLPTGLLLLVFGPFFFLGVSILYTVLATLQDAFSRSIVIVIAVVMGIAFFASLLYTAAPMSVIILGGNVVWVGLVIGWYLGAMFQPEK